MHIPVSVKLQNYMFEPNQLHHVLQSVGLHSYSSFYIICVVECIAYNLTRGAWTTAKQGNS